MFFKSSDCLDIFPNNNSSRFFVKIPEIVSFNKDQTICVVDLKIPQFLHPNITSIYVVTNIVSEIFVGGSKLSAVQRYFVKSDVESNGFELDPQMVENNVKDIDTDVIEVGILDGDTLQYVQCKEGNTYCAFKIV